MPSDEAIVNEYLLDAYELKKQQVEMLKTQLREVTERYEVTLNTYADVCRRNDKMQQAGDVLRDLLIELVVLSDTRVEAAIQNWGTANV